MRISAGPILHTPDTYSDLELKSTLSATGKPPEKIGIYQGWDHGFLVNTYIHEKTGIIKFPAAGFRYCREGASPSLQYRYFTTHSAFGIIRL
jgi:hypothetical protein